MPIGVTINCLAVLLGGLIGAKLKSRIPENLIEKLPTVFGLSALTIGVFLIAKLENLAPVILAIILGTIIGELFQIEDNLKKHIHKLLEKVGGADPHRIDILVIVITLFCFSGTGLFGALNEGFTGNGSILIAKAIMDFFTAMIFGASTGYMVSVTSIPQFGLYLVFFYSAGFIVPLLNSAMLSDFKACGGIITLAAGLKLAKVVDINLVNMLPALALVMSFTYYWDLLGL